MKKLSFCLLVLISLHCFGQDTTLSKTKIVQWGIRSGWTYEFENYPSYYSTFYRETRLFPSAQIFLQVKNKFYGGLSIDRVRFYKENTMNNINGFIYSGSKVKGQGFQLFVDLKYAFEKWRLYAFHPIAGLLGRVSYDHNSSIPFLSTSFPTRNINFSNQINFSFGLQKDFGRIFLLLENGVQILKWGFNTSETNNPQLPVKNRKITTITFSTKIRYSFLSFSVGYRFGRKR